MAELDLTADEVNALIRDDLMRLSYIGFDDMEPGRLPLRPDARVYVSHYLCGGNQARSPFQFGGVGRPTVELDSAGGILIVFLRGDRRVSLYIPVDGVVLARREMHRGATITMRLPIDRDALCAECAHLCAWLRAEEDGS